LRRYNFSGEKLKKYVHIICEKFIGNYIARLSIIRGEIIVFRVALSPIHTFENG